jgi:restriction system protein
MIPDFQSIMLPLLQLAADGQEHSLAEAREVLSGHFSVTPEELEQLLPSGRQAVFANRVAWAKSYLVQAGILDATKRAHFRISQRGKEVLAAPPPRIDISFLEQYPEFVEFRYRRGSQEPEQPSIEDPETETPEEQLERAHTKLRRALATELLSRVKAGTPQFFERLVVELLLKMGYGGSRDEAGETIGRSGDEGIDGIISEDRLGLDVVYLQAKKWEGTVGRPEIQKFVGALHGKRARKGVFLTTGQFSQDARDYVAHIDPRVVLIDGRQIAEMMIDFEVGVATATTYAIKRIDSDYFGEE